MQQAKALDYPHRSVEQRKSCMRIFSAKTMFNLFYIVRRYIFCFAHHISGSWRLAESCRKGAPCLRKPPWSRTNKNYGCSRTDPWGIVQRMNYGRVQVFDTPTGSCVELVAFDHSASLTWIPPKLFPWQGLNRRTCEYVRNPALRWGTFINWATKETTILLQCLVPDTKKLSDIYKSDWPSGQRRQV